VLALALHLSPAPAQAVSVEPPRAVDTPGPLYPKGASFNGVTADVRLTYRF